MRPAATNRTRATFEYLFSIELESQLALNLRRLGAYYVQCYKPGHGCLRRTLHLPAASAPPPLGPKRGSLWATSRRCACPNRRRLLPLRVIRMQRAQLNDVKLGMMEKLTEDNSTPLGDVPSVITADGYESNAKQEALSQLIAQGAQAPQLLTHRCTFPLFLSLSLLALWFPRPRACATESGSGADGGRDRGG